MPTSNENLSRVKNILRKMDQSIDAARSRRLSTAPSSPAPMPAPIPPPSLNAGFVPPPVTNANVNRALPLRAKPLQRPA